MNVSVPALNVPPPRLIDVPFTSARFVTVTLVAPASLIAPVESRSRLDAVLTPTRSTAESSLITTAPAELNVSVPALNVPPPRLIDVPFMSARFVALTLVAPASLIDPVESKSRL